MAPSFAAEACIDEDRGVSSLSRRCAFQVTQAVNLEEILIEEKTRNQIVNKKQEFNTLISAIQSGNHAHCLWMIPIDNVDFYNLLQSIENDDAKYIYRASTTKCLHKYLDFVIKAQDRVNEWLAQRKNVRVTINRKLEEFNTLTSAIQSGNHAHRQWMTTQDIQDFNNLIECVSTVYRAPRAINEQLDFVIKAENSVINWLNKRENERKTINRRLEEFNTLISTIQARNHTSYLWMAPNDYQDFNNLIASISREAMLPKDHLVFLDFLIKAQDIVNAWLTQRKNVRETINRRLEEFNTLTSAIQARNHPNYLWMAPNDYQDFNNLLDDINREKPSPTNYEPSAYLDFLIGKQGIVDDWLTQRKNERKPMNIKLGELNTFTLAIRSRSHQNYLWMTPNDLQEFQDLLHNIKREEPSLTNYEPSAYINFYLDFVAKAQDRVNDWLTQREIEHSTINLPH